MRTESQQGFMVGRPGRAAIPRYLIYFAMPPVNTTFVILGIEPMAGMTLLACFVVMWIVLRVFLHVVPRQSQLPEESGPLFLDLSSHWSIPLELIHPPTRTTLLIPTNDGRGAQQQ